MRLVRENIYQAYNGLLHCVPIFAYNVLVCQCDEGKSALNMFFPEDLSSQSEFTSQFKLYLIHTSVSSCPGHAQYIINF